MINALRPCCRSSFFTCAAARAPAGRRKRCGRLSPWLARRRARCIARTTRSIAHAVRQIRNGAARGGCDDAAVAHRRQATWSRRSRYLRRDRAVKSLTRTAGRARPSRKREATAEVKPTRDSARDRATSSSSRDAKTWRRLTVARSHPRWCGCRARIRVEDMDAQRAAAAVPR